MTNPPAATISTRQTLDLLDGQFREFANGVAEGRYAFWLGSGISLGRVGGLNKVVSRVVEFLRSRVIAENPECRFRKALAEVIQLAQLPQEHRDRINLAVPYDQWPDVGVITTRLSSNYARLLETAVDGEVNDFVLWDGVDVPKTFADPSIEPDAEHICVGILILEGVLSDIASANWDGLVEKAVEGLTAAGYSALAVCVRQQDLRQPQLKAWLFKFHGCAVKARQIKRHLGPI